MVLRCPDPSAVLETLLGLLRSVELDSEPAKIIGAYIGAFERLMPGRRISLRVSAHGQSGNITLYGSPLDPLRDAMEGPSVRDANVGAVEPAHTGISEVSVSLDALPDDVEDVTRSDVPLMDGENVVGLMWVEYALGETPPAGDAVVLRQLAVGLGTALRHARRLRESALVRNHLDALLDQAKTPVLVLGAHREVVLANEAFLQLAGLRRGDVDGKSLFDLTPASDRDALKGDLAAVAHADGPVGFTLSLRSLPVSRRRVPMSAISTLALGKGGDLMLAVGRDLREIQELERQVFHAEKLATLGQLAAGVVHELNNPLTSISVYCDYLLTNADARGMQPDDIEKLRRIARSGERILRFTRDLVAYARPTTEEPRFTDLAEVVDQAVVFCEHVIRDVGATVEKRYGDGLGLYGISGQLHQVFINLVTNACQAMPEGAGKLTLILERVDDEHIVAKVRDNGAGIAADILDGIFEPFFSTKGEGKGTGLGLSIVRKIVEQHRGRVTATSVIGEGATFTVVLPSRRDGARAC